MDIGVENHYSTFLSYCTLHKTLDSILGKAYDQLYGGQNIEHSLEAVAGTVSHELLLEHWRDDIAPGLQWDDQGPLPSKKLATRLYTRYQDVRHALNIPFLDCAHSMIEGALHLHGLHRKDAEVRLLESIASMHPYELHAGCVRCVDAAVSTTLVYNNVLSRFILTNAHGAAHA
jgi:hypothetical protein